MYFGSVKRRRLVIASGGVNVATCGHIACPGGRVDFTERNDVCHYLEAGKGGTVAPSLAHALVRRVGRPVTPLSGHGGVLGAGLVRGTGAPVDDP
jgi:hypothetical protein